MYILEACPADGHPCLHLYKWRHILYRSIPSEYRKGNRSMARTTWIRTGLCLLAVFVLLCAGLALAEETPSVSLRIKGTDSVAELLKNEGAEVEISAPGATALAAALATPLALPPALAAPPAPAPPQRAHPGSSARQNASKNATREDRSVFPC